jgi:hypothetical protein
VSLNIYCELKIRETDLCTCGTAPMTTEHLLQECPSYDNERSETGTKAVTLHNKLYGDEENLEMTTSVFKRINV